MLPPPPPPGAYPAPPPILVYAPIAAAPAKPAPSRLPIILVVVVVVALVAVAGLIFVAYTFRPSDRPDSISGIGVSVGGTGNSTVTSPGTGAFTQNANGTCSFSLLSPHGGAVLIISVDSSTGAGMEGVTVTLSASTGLADLSAAPSLSATTGVTGIVSYSSVTGLIEANNPAGGQIDVVAEYVSGGITTTGSGQVIVEPPSTMTC